MFSTGFATIELKVYATCMLRDYKLEFADPEAPVPKVIYPATLALDGELRVKFTRRRIPGAAE